jgi:hypothetical protein
MNPMDIADLLDETFGATLHDLPDDMIDHIHKALQKVSRRAYAKGWNDCCDTFRVGCHIAEDRAG